MTPPPAKDVGPAGGLARRLLLAPPAGHPGAGQHVQNGRDAEVQRLLQRRPEVVCVWLSISPGSSVMPAPSTDLRVLAGGCRNVGAGA